HLGQPSDWSSAKLDIGKALRATAKSNGRGLRILTETVNSPTLADQLAGERKGTVPHEFSDAKWYQYEPTHGDARQMGTRLVFGIDVDAIYDFAAADVVVSLDADFLSLPAAGLRYARGFMGRRAAARRAMGGRSIDAEQADVNRLYVVDT